MHRTRLVTACVLALSVAGTAHATISEALSLSDLVGRADHVVVATALDQDARYDAHGRIVTDFTVQVDEVMKGSARVGSTLVMTRLGGEIGDVGMRIEGEPHLVLGSRYVLFLRTMRDGRTLRPVGMSQGVMPLEDRSGQLTVLPGGGGLALMQRVQGGRLIPAPAAIVHPEPYALFRSRLDQVVEDDRSGTVSP